MGKRTKKVTQTYIDYRPATIGELAAEVCETIKRDYNRYGHDISELRLQELRTDLAYYQKALGKGEMYGMEVELYIRHRYGIDTEIQSKVMGNVRHESKYVGGFNYKLNHEQTTRLLKVLNAYVFVSPVDIETWHAAMNAELLPVTEDEVTEIGWENFGEELGKPPRLKVKNIKLISYVLDELSTRQLIAQNWQTIAADCQTFASIQGNPISRTGYGTPKHILTTGTNKNGEKPEVAAAISAINDFFRTLK